MVSRRKGGPGSGNFGHEGRPGQVGGSGDGGGSGEDTHRPETRVGVTSARPGKAPEKIREQMGEFTADLGKTPAKNVSVEEGRGAWNGDHEITWVTSYDGNGEAMRTCAKYGAETEQDSVLFMKQSSEDDPAALPVSHLRLSGKEVDDQYIEEIEAKLVEADVGYWTWTKDTSGNPTIMIAAVKFFGDTRESHAETIGKVKELMGSGVAGERVEWRRNELVWNPAKVPEGGLTYDDVLKRGASPFGDSKKSLARIVPTRIIREKENETCRSTLQLRTASAPPPNGDGYSRKDSETQESRWTSGSPTARSVRAPDSSSKTTPTGRTSWSPPGSPSRKSPNSPSSSIATPQAGRGTVSPLDKDEREFRKAVQQQFRAQTAQVHSRVEQGHKAAAVDVDTKKWDRDMVEAVRPTWYGVFKRSGDAALKRVRRKDGSAVEFVCEKTLKAQPRPGSIVIPEWVEDPNVLRAIEREMFKFAHEINQTTADLLREELLDGMELGETIAQLSDRIAGLSDEWVEGWRSEMIARTETTRATTVGNIEAWRSTGVVERKVWLPAGDACPFCLAMDGIAVGLDENFLDEGDTQEVEWREQDIEMKQNYGDVKGPPLHPNCRCVLIGELTPQAEKMLVEKGGPGSGNFGHEGRPGEVGGSGGGGGESVESSAPTKEQLDRAHKVFTAIQSSDACDRQMRGGMLKANGTFVEFTPKTKQTNLNKIVKELDDLKAQDPEAFELARQWDLADRLGVEDYKEIPDEISVWRGHDEDESLGKVTNVSHLKEVAEKFGATGVVTEYRVKKEDIVFSLSNSVFDEGELIVRGKTLKEQSRTVSEVAQTRMDFRKWSSSVKVGDEITSVDGRVGKLRMIGVGQTMVVEFPEGTDYRFTFQKVKR